jgi:hypothetical protein
MGQMLLGLISLVLVVAEGDLIDHCVIGGDPDCSSVFWEYSTVHELHVLLFLIACTHVLYVTTVYPTVMLTRYLRVSYSGLETHGN